MARLVDGLHGAEIAHPGSVVDFGVGVQHLAPASRAGQSQPVARVLTSREVEYAGHRRAAAAESQKAQHVVRRIVRVDPRVALRTAVVGPERRAGAVDLVEIVDHSQNAAGEAAFAELKPVTATLFRPFRTLAELLAHEQQLLARVGP